MENFSKLFESFGSIRVGVIGDVMLDTYMWGSVERISPEAPVPVVTINKKDYRIGGAGNVALNVRSLGAQVSLLSIIGNDDDGKRFLELCKENAIASDHILELDTRITTSKTRVISRNQQMMRLDAEVTKDISREDEDKLILKASSFIKEKKPHILIFEDYNKGILTERVILEVIRLCKSSGVLTTVDPKRKNFFSYKECDVFKPNLKEVKEALNLLVEDIDEDSLTKIHIELKSILHHSVSFITLSEKGVFYKSDSESKLIPSHIRNIADVSGAGDTVIAVASLVYAATKNLHLMAEVANIAGGLVCEEVGTVAIDKGKLVTECEKLIS
jgi:rfaE bifunctional protein kinase chain/domain